MTDKIFKVLFLCTGISTRSLFAESILNRVGQGKFRAFSAGSHPWGEITTELERDDYGIEDLPSKDWQEVDQFAQVGYEAMEGKQT